MPEKKSYFPQAENNQHNVANVLSDTPWRHADDAHKTIEDTPTPQEVKEELEREIEEDEDIDLNALLSDYAARVQDDAPEETVEALPQDEVAEEAQEETAQEEVPREPLYIEDEEAGVSVGNPVIQRQADKAREPFVKDARNVDEEPAIRRLHAGELDERQDDIPSLHELDEEMEEAPEEEAQPVSRIRKPRFSKRAKEEKIIEDTTQPENVPPADILEAPEEKEAPVEEEKETDIYEEELAQALEAQKKNDSICDELHELEQYLEEARSPLMHKTEVLVPREKTLRLISSLTAICDVNPEYIDGAEEDFLIDRLVSNHTKDDYKPLERARNRAQAIINDATQKAEFIISDAKTLSAQILSETETEIKNKYDEADERIALRMTTAKEESSKKLNEARSELTVSRQRSVEILSKYLEKAESDYQGYWERAENTVMASLEQSESILAKAEEIYKKELDVIKQDKEEIEEILDDLKRRKRFR